MRSLINATTAMDFVDGRENRTDVAGMIVLREQGPRFPRLYTRLVLRASVCLSGVESERHPARCRPASSCSVKHGSHWRWARFTDAQPSAPIA